jgi:hypothetical protein
MDLDAILRRIQDTDIGTAIRENGSLFPWIESLHVLSLTVVLGSVAILDLRLLGWASRDRSVDKVLADVSPRLWAAFGFAFVTGSLLFSSNALTYAHNPLFRSKIVLLILLALNTATFERGVKKRLSDWQSAATPPAWARVAGAVSIVLWIGVTVCGRWIGFSRVPVPP